MRLADGSPDTSGLPLIVVQLARFIGVGSLSTFLHVAAAFLANLFGAPPLAANMVGFLSGVTVSYLGNFYWTFAGVAEHRQSLGRFAVMCALALIVTTAIAYLVQAVGWPFVAALLLMLVTVPPMNFVLGRMWVFRSHAEDSVSGGAEIVAIVVCCVAAAWFYSATMPHPDVGWYLISTSRWLAGERLYEDILELNPPLAFFLMVPSTLLSEVTNWSPMASFALVVCAATGVSLLESRRLLAGSTVVTDVGRGAILAAAFLSLVILPVGYFGEREHLMMILALPYMVAVAFRPPLSNGERVGVALAAALGFAVKPHFLVFPMLVALVEFARRPKLATLFSLENLVIGGFCVAYLIFSWVNYPAYFSTIVPTAVLVYGAYGVRHPLQLFTALLSFLLLWRVFLRSAREGPELRAAATMLLALTVGAFACYFAQAKGWRYHLIPIYALLCIAWALFGTLMVSNIRHYGRLWTALVLGLAVILTIPTLRGPVQSSITRNLSPYLEELDGERSLLVLTAHVFFSFPLANMTDSKVASSFPALWFIPGAVAQLGLDAEMPASRRRALEDTLESARRITTGDLIRGRPKLVFVDVNPRKPYFDGVRFEYLEFFLKDAGFRDEWRSYRLIDRWENIEVWKRTDAEDSPTRLQ